MKLAIIITSVLLIVASLWAAWTNWKDRRHVTLGERAVYDDIMNVVGGVPARSELEALCGPPDQHGRYVTASIGRYRRTLAETVLSPPGAWILFVALGVAAILSRENPFVAWALITVNTLWQGGALFYGVRRLMNEGSETLIYAAPFIPLRTRFSEALEELGEPTSLTCPLSSDHSG